MYIHISPRAKSILKIKDPGMYFIRFLLTTDFVDLNTLSPPAGNATSACVSISCFADYTLHLLYVLLWYWVGNCRFSSWYASRGSWSVKKPVFLISYEHFVLGIFTELLLCISSTVGMYNTGDLKLTHYLGKNKIRNSRLKVYWI